MVKIAFWTPFLSARGSDVALFDYAYYNQTILNNKSIIILSFQGVFNSDRKVLEKFTTHFPVKYYIDESDLSRILITEKCDILYSIIHGQKGKECIDDEKLKKLCNIKTVYHCVFDMSDKRGDVYAGVSHSLAKKFDSDVFVPHMISLKPNIQVGDFRKELNIPSDSVVFGRYGGEDIFNLKWFYTTVEKVANDNKNIYFLFQENIKKYFTKDFDNIKFVKTFYTDDEKNKFINTCDATLECSTLGHSFGLTLGEFSVCNKPIILLMSDIGYWNVEHIRIISNKGIYFRNDKELYRVLTNFKREKFIGQDLNLYKEFSPENVMKIFDNVFIKNEKIN